MKICYFGNYLMNYEYFCSRIETNETDMIDKIIDTTSRVDKYKDMEDLVDSPRALAANIYENSHCHRFDERLSEFC